MGDVRAEIRRHLSGIWQSLQNEYHMMVLESKGVICLGGLCPHPSSLNYKDGGHPQEVKPNLSPAPASKPQQCP